MSTMSRRTLLLTALGGAAVAGLAGCSRGGSPSGGGTEAGEGGTAIRFAWWGSTPRHEMTEAALELFRAEHADIAVTTEPAEFSAYFNRLATQTAADDAPDVITLGGAYVAEYAQREALLDLGEVAGVLDLSSMDETTVTNGQVEGVQYAATTGVNALAVLTNPEVFEQAGVELPDDRTWSWEEFEDIAERISAATPDGVYGSAGTLTHDSIDCWARQRGEALYTPDGQLGLDVETLAALFETSKRMTETGAAPPATVLTEMDGLPNEQTLLGTGRAAMMLTWSNALASMSDASGADLLLLDLPGETPQPGLWLQSSQYYAISARSAHPEQAAALISFLLTSPEAAAITRTDRGVPTSAAIREAIAPELNDREQAEVDYIDYQSGKDLQQLVIGPAGSTEVAGITTRLLSEVVFGNLTPAEAAQSWIEQAEQAIA
ncbi:ABC transporter substrate-binding protein [Pseudactinotalea sp.]|uniref:ABC transporter substrate-binding protein n=1 Tax=Pseudactinotalea sp. TaxID=1926260 RepID=UPI003B3AA3F2